MNLHVTKCVCICLSVLASISLPVDHARWASLSKGEASGGVCGRFRIHGGRREGGCGQPAGGGVLSQGPQGLSLLSASEREQACALVIDKLFVNIRIVIKKNK